jgi:hypothetical protein
MGGYLVPKLVKQTKIDSWFKDQTGIDKITLIETKSKERAGRARVLRKADPAVWQKQARFDPSDCVFD